MASPDDRSMLQGAAANREGPDLERAGRGQRAAGAEPEGRSGDGRQGTVNEHHTVRGLSLSHTLRPWPAHREAHGFLRLRDSMCRTQGMDGLCSVVDGMLSFRVEENPGAGFNVLLAEVAVANMAVTVQAGKYTSFSIDSSSLRADTVYCDAYSQEKRNKWLAVFRCMGVPLWADYGDGIFRSVYVHEFGAV